MADVARTAGRGVVYIAAAKLYFMVAGYVVYFALPRLLGSAAAFGEYLLVVGLASVIDNVIVSGTIQAVSRYTAQAEGRADAVKRAALEVQLLLGGGIALAYLLAAPAIAAFENDPALVPLYRISAGIVLCYAFYAVFVGSANGQRRFGQQASLDAGFSTIKTALILAAAGSGLGVAGAVGGFATAAAVILAVAAVWVGLPRGAARFPRRRIWSFMAQLFAYTLLLNLVLRVDLFLLKRFVVGVAGGAKQASAAAGVYGAAQSLAFIPYQAILSVAFVVFPLVSRATFERDMAATRAYVRETLRFSALFVTGVAVVFVAAPAAVLAVPYPAAYAAGAPALRVLAIGMVGLSLFTIVNTILNGAGRTRDTISSALVTAALAAGANALLVPRAASVAQALILAAACTSGAIAVGLAISSLQLRRAFGAGLAPLTALRALAAGAVAVAAGMALPLGSRLATVGGAVVVVAVYVVALVLLGEVSRDDLRRIRRIVRR